MLVPSSLIWIFLMMPYRTILKNKRLMRSGFTKSLLLLKEENSGRIELQNFFSIKTQRSKKRKTIRPSIPTSLVMVHHPSVTILVHRKILPYRTHGRIRGLKCKRHHRDAFQSMNPH
mmetsp:Transcript_68/g.123  ORF Transcript_68/g.123 Transcript_68/m.123 type:complete len:117 (+) Transcript_68:3683-4033(+)